MTVRAEKERLRGWQRQKAEEAALLAAEQGDDGAAAEAEAEEEDGDAAMAAALAAEQEGPAPSRRGDRGNVRLSVGDMVEYKPLVRGSQNKRGGWS